MCELQTHLHWVDVPAPIVPLFRRRSLDAQKPVDTADHALDDVAAARCGRGVSCQPPRISESRCKRRLNYIVTYSLCEARPSCRFIGNINSVDECDFTSRDTIRQFEAAQGEKFKLASRAFKNGGGHRAHPPLTAP
jgi:hypothetical protein